MSVNTLSMSLVPSICNGKQPTLNSRANDLSQPTACAVECHSHLHKDVTVVVQHGVDIAVVSLQPVDCLQAQGDRE